MARRLIGAVVTTALCLAPMAPGAALAQEHRFSGLEAPRGATATIDLRVPLGRENAGQASYGLTLGYGQTVGAGLDGRTSSRMMNVADLRFSQRGELRNARLVGFDLAHPDQDRLMIFTGSDDKAWIFLAAIAAILGIALCVAVICDSGGPPSSDEESPSPY